MRSNLFEQDIHLDTDIVRTYKGCFDSISGHMTGKNTFTDSSNVFLFDGSGKWRQRTDLGIPGSIGDDLCQME